MEEDASNAERNTASIDTAARGLVRKLVNRKTLIIALQILFWVVKIAPLLSRLIGNS
jgi:hypothetical protein